MLDDNAASLLQPFQDEAEKWVVASGCDIKSSIHDTEDVGGQSLLSLLLELRKLKGMGTRSKVRGSICDSYCSILNATKDMEASTLWLLKHNVSSAGELLEILRASNDDVLITDGFWIVQDDRKSGSISNRHTNLSRLLDRAKDCRMRFETSMFGVSVTAPTAAGYGRGPISNLHDFIVLCAAVERTIAVVMELFIGSDGDIVVFQEALSYNIPPRCRILYDHDLDLDRHLSTRPLMFTSGQSIVDARASHLKIECRDDYDEEVVELYEFPNITMDPILRGDCKVSHNIPLVDDGFGACVRAWVEDGHRPEDGFLRIIHGVTRGAIIASMFGTRTSIHVEDSMLATFNLLVFGAPKIWYIVPNRNGDLFRQFLKRQGLLGAAFEKRCFVQAFADRDLALSRSDMERFEVCRVVQRPGMTIMTIPGMIFHWTISTGFSLADSVNYYCRYRGGINLQELEGLWNAYEEDGGNSEFVSSRTSRQYFDTCKKFKIF
jgi:hypothetical protein